MAGLDELVARICWSGRKDLNLRPLRPERSALPGCATPRPGEVSRKGVASILHQRVETQAVRLRHAAAGHLALREVHTLRQSRIGTHSGIHA